MCRGRRSKKQRGDREDLGAIPGVQVSDMSRPNVSSELRSLQQASNLAERENTKGEGQKKGVRRIIETGERNKTEREMGGSCTYS